MTGTTKGNVFSVGDQVPDIADDVFIAPGAQVMADVTIGKGSSVWFNCVLRGDVQRIVVGAGTNIQDGTVIHVTRKTHGTFIGDNVLIGHMAMIHGCTLKDWSFVGLGSIVMDGCVIEEDGMLAAGGMLTPGRTICKGDLWGGRPAKFMRKLSAEEIAKNRKASPHYAHLAQVYRQSLKPR